MASLKTGYGDTPEGEGGVPLIEHEDGTWYLNDGIGRTIQLHRNLKNKTWAAPYIATLQSKGYTIA